MQVLDRPSTQEAISDESLAVAAKAGDVQAMEWIIEKYKPIVRFQARHYFMLGAEHEDVIQEGMIGLYKGVRDFDPTKSTHFRPFAELCIKRQIVTAIKMGTRKKHIPLNAALSLDKPVSVDDDLRTFHDVLPSAEESNPLNVIIHQDSVGDIKRRVYEQLTDLERQMLSLYLEGYSYNQIANRTARGTKSVDNALQRAKAKIKKKLADLDVP